MKHLKTFEARNIDEEVEILDDVIKENPLHVDHDFYIFIARDKFEEDDDGRYTKTIEIENMVKITADRKSIGAIQGMEMRARFSPDSSLYHIWLPKDFEKLVSGKGSYSMDKWLVDLINKYKSRGADSHGKEVLKKVQQRRINAKKYNL